MGVKLREPQGEIGGAQSRGEAAARATCGLAKWGQVEEGEGDWRTTEIKGPERTGPSAREPQGVAGSCSWRAASGRRFVCPEGDFCAQICPPGRYFLS